MSQVTYSAERARSDSPGDVSPARILEWNFMASRINGVVAMLSAHKRLNVPPNMKHIADGMCIEQAVTGLISGRLAIEGERIASQPLYNHALAFRHSIDKGQRVLQTLVDKNILLPRWGSYNSTPPPTFKDLPFYVHTDREDWQNFCGAGGLDADGTQWWKFERPITLNEYAIVKSADAARIWFRLNTENSEGYKFVPEPTLGLELRYALAWLTGVHLSLVSSTNGLDAAISTVQSRLVDAYVKETAREPSGTSATAAVRNSVQDNRDSM